METTTLGAMLRRIANGMPASRETFLMMADKADQLQDGIKDPDALMHGQYREKVKHALESAMQNVHDEMIAKIPVRSARGFVMPVITGATRAELLAHVDPDRSANDKLKDGYAVFGARQEKVNEIARAALLLDGGRIVYQCDGCQHETFDDHPSSCDCEEGSTFTARVWFPVPTVGVADVAQYQYRYRSAEDRPLCGWLALPEWQYHAIREIRAGDINYEFRALGLLREVEKPGTLTSEGTTSNKITGHQNCTVCGGDGQVEIANGMGAYIDTCPRCKGSKKEPGQ